MSTTDIRILYPEGCTDQDGFAADIEEAIHTACMNPPRVCDMPSHVIITIATGDLMDVASALRDAKLI